MVILFAYNYFLLCARPGKFKLSLYILFNDSRFDYIVANNNLEGDSDEEALKYHIKIIQLIRLDLQRAMEIYEKLFVKYV